MPLLYYWKPEIYRRDLDMGAGYHLNQKNKLLHSVDVGDSLWAFTRNRTGRYVLAAELVVKAKTTNSPSYYYGLYRVWGDLTKSRYFRVDEQSPDIEKVLRSFSIKTGSSVLGRSFQGGAAVRTIAESEQQLLMVLAKDLPLEPRAGIYPEERLEALLYSENAIAVEKLVVITS